MGGLDHRPDVVGDVPPVAGEHLADVHDHVELGRPIVHRRPGLEHLHLREVSAVGEPDDGAGEHAGAGEQLRGEAHGVGLDAHRRDVVLGGHLAAAGQLGVGEHRLEQRVVEHLGQLGERRGGHGRLQGSGDRGQRSECGTRCRRLPLATLTPWSPGPLIPWA